MNSKIKEFLAFLESVKTVDQNAVDRIADATLTIFDENNVLFEGGLSKAIHALGDASGISKPVKKALKMMGKGDDVVSGAKRSLDDIGGIRKSADDIEGAGKKLVDDIPAPKKTSKFKKALGAAGIASTAGAIGAALMDDGDGEADDKKVELARRTPEKDTSGRFWPNNFYQGSLNSEQQSIIDTGALFGANTIDETLLSEISDGSSNEDEIMDAVVRYNEVYNYWSAVYRNGMTTAYDDQMDKNLTD